MEIPTHSELVAKIDQFLERHKVAVTRLGREINGDPNLIPNIRNGRQPNLETLNRLATYMAEQDASASAPSVVSSSGNADELTAQVEAVPGAVG